MKMCYICQKTIQPNPKSHSSNTRKYCSYGCYWKSLKGKPSYNKGKAAPWAKNLPQQFQKGHRPPVTAFKKGSIPWNKGIIWERMRGGNHPLWNGGISEKVRKYNRDKSKKWAKLIFQRDKWICVDCNIKERILNAHHVKSWKDYPKFRFNIENGVTLCVPCHKKRHYGSIHNSNFPGGGKR